MVFFWFVLLERVSLGFVLPKKRKKQANLPRVSRQGVQITKNPRVPVGLLFWASTGRVKPEHEKVSSFQLKKRKKKKSSSQKENTPQLLEASAGAVRESGWDLAMGE